MKKDLSSKQTILFAVTISQSLQFVRGFPEALSGRGWEVHVASSSGSELEEMRASGTLAHSLEMARDPNLLQDLSSLMTWFKLLRKIKPDVVVLGTPKASLLGMISAWVLRVPKRAYIIHGLRLETATGMLKVILRTVERLIIALSTNVIAVGEDLRNAVVNQGIARRSDIAVVPRQSANGVDLGVFTSDENALELEDLRASQNISNTKFTVGFVGRITRDKGIVELTNALARLVKDGRDFQLVLLGKVEDDIGAEALRRIMDAPYDSFVQGYVDPPVSYMKLMDILVLPSYREGFPITPLEAAAIGLPVIGTDVTGMRDAVVDNVTGVLVAPRSAEAIYRKLIWAMDNPSELVALGVRAKSYGRANFSRELVIEEYLEELKLNGPHEATMR